MVVVRRHPTTMQLPANSAWADEVQRLSTAPVASLVARYQELFTEPPRSRNRVSLLRRIAWRLQANLSGGLAQRALERARMLANDRDLRLTAPQARRKSGATPARPARDPRLPLPGTVIKRHYRNGEIAVKVLVDGFEYDGQRFVSLSGVAEHVTGTRWNGFAFFRLQRRKRAA